MVEVEAKLSHPGAIVVYAPEVERHGKAFTHACQHSSETNIRYTCGQDTVRSVRTASHKVQLDQDLPQRIHGPVKRSEVQHAGFNEWLSFLKAPHTS